MNGDRRRKNNVSKVPVQNIFQHSFDLRKSQDEASNSFNFYQYSYQALPHFARNKECTTLQQNVMKRHFIPLPK